MVKKEVSIRENKNGTKMFGAVDFSMPGSYRLENNYGRFKANY